MVYAEADYGLWESIVVQPVDLAIIEELRRDDQTVPIVIVDGGDYWPAPGEEIALVPTRTLQPTLQATATPVSVFVPSTSTPTNRPPYQTPLVIVLTGTATNVPVPPLSTS